MQGNLYKKLIEFSPSLLHARKGDKIYLKAKGKRTIVLSVLSLQKKKKIPKTIPISGKISISGLNTTKEGKKKIEVEMKVDFQNKKADCRDNVYIFFLLHRLLKQGYKEIKIEKIKTKKEVK